MSITFLGHKPFCSTLVYEISADNIGDAYEIMYKNMGLRNKIIRCNEGDSFEFHTSNKMNNIQASLYISYN